MNDIVFIQPNCPGPYRDSGILAESLGLALLLAVSKKAGFSSTIVDARMDDLSSVDAANLSHDCAMIGLSFVSGEAIEWSKEFISECKKRNPNIHFVAGGYYATLLPEVLMKQIPDLDCVMIGEGEVTIVEILNHYLKNATDTLEEIKGIVYRDGEQIKRTSERNVIENLDDNPLCYRYAPKVSENGFEVLIEGSRGCPNNCTFCAIKPFFGKKAKKSWRCRSAQSLIDELKYIKMEYPKAMRVRFVDPDFLGDNVDGIKRAREFCDLLIENDLLDFQFCIETRVVNITEDNYDLLKKMKQVGFVEIYLGLESGSDNILKTMNKGVTAKESLSAVRLLNKVGIDVVYGFMMFTPWTTMEDVAKNVDFLTEVGDVQFDRLFYKLNLVPQTPCVKLAQHKGLLLSLNREGYYEYNYEHDDVAALASIWDYLQKKHMYFLKKIWYLYKDVKTWMQSEPNCAKPYLDKVSMLSLQIFEQLCEITSKGAIDISKNCIEINSIVESGCVKIDELSNKFSNKFRFPRKK